MHRSYLSKASLGQRLASTVLPLATLLAFPLNAQDTAEPQLESTRCISATRIDNTEIIDDQTIAFHMRGKDIYLNRLPHRCPSMRSHSTIAYKTQTSQLCRVDSITVLNTAGGISRGPTCGLGEFTLITKDELKAIKNPESATEEEAGNDTQ